VLILVFNAMLLERKRVGTDLSDRLGELVFAGPVLLALAGIFLGVRKCHDGTPFV
jgi:hypothetical protein